MTVSLEVRDLSKSYGHVSALDGVGFSGRGGEVIALLGDNGAGKSTLVKILSGVVHADSGTIVVDGQERQLTTPKEAREVGIETVHQNLALSPNLDVSSNLFLNREIRHGNPVLRWLGWVDEKRMRATSASVLGELGVKMPSVRQDVEFLSGGQRQAVAVGRAVGWGNQIVLLDEPAAALGVEQTALVLDLIRNMRSKGVLVVLITHNMQEVLDVCDRAVVLRRGRVAADVDVASVTGRDLVDHITGTV
jgi:simple sugar transport system ATP-binding protein